MKIAALTFAVSLLAVPALAQTSDTSTGSANTGTDSAATTSQTGVGPMDQQKLRDQLSQAGFSNVQILDASYLVQAQTQDGNQVLMVIDPPMRGAMGSTSTNNGGASQDATSGETKTGSDQ
ncbi:hypothetical protein FE840_002160 [Peteryoungia desertarenae]|uniref:PepSY domain-containing protein n=1 Tax=Peteryoungia desertarenae TaxID=1813451 RepID=A0ABX6QJI5_9HYPH|nr:hypothetical protein [Peteryoungia desertarenae]QLF68447.1 hypothetical protein FE840_002160 [Peteryoungia desertarenae]